MTDHNQVYEGREFEAAANLANYYRWITDTFRPFLQGAGTEIGAGIGNYAKYLRPHFTQLDLVEPSPVQHPALNALFKDDARVQVFQQSISTYRQQVGNTSRDCFCLVNVLEHIEDDNDALADMTAMLKPGGHICLFVPALPFLYSNLDKMVGHHRRYTRRVLTDRMSAAGLEVVVSKYMDILGIPAWGLVNTLLGSTSLNPRMVSIYDNLCVPLTRAAEAIIPIPFGKSLLAVGRKRA